MNSLLRRLGSPPVEFEFVWSGERVGGNRGCHQRVQVRKRGTLYKLLRNPHVAFGDAYCNGSVAIEGNLVAFMLTLFRTLPDRDRRSRLAAWFHSMHGGRNTISRARDDIHRHYDLGNEFYSLWLGSTMAYTCAYYPSSRASLDQAQAAKMDHICRKLKLTAEDHVIEAGCGWGSLALHMAKRYGARVRAFNISKQQIEFARQRVRAEGLTDRVEFIEDDYRNITGTCSAFVSVGMLEHVGRDHYPHLGVIAQRTMTSEGRGLIHSIGRNRPGELHPWIEQRIFPGAYPPSIGEMMQVFEPNGLSVLDVENLRLHYARTLRDWLERYEAASDQVGAMFGENFVRKWRLYLAGSIAAFETGSLQLFQVLFTQQDNNAIPWTRDYMYPA